MFHHPRLFLPILAAALLPNIGSALVITPDDDPSVLSNTLFLNSPGLSVTNSVLNSGTVDQIGTYENTTGTLGLPLDGIVLSSGNINELLSAGSTSITGDSATGAQNALLSPITGQSGHFDVVDLLINFDAAPNVSNVTFFASFISTEWPDFVDSSFTDGFGLFVNGTNVAGVEPTGGGTNLPVNIDHPDMTSLSGFVGPQVDDGSSPGVLAPNGNPVLRFDVPVNPGEENVFQIILADASDSVLDTGIFLSSFLPTDPVGPSDGTTEFNPILPSNPPDPETGAFVLELPADLQDNEVVWIDPPVSVGYTYELSGGASAFASIVAPSLATIADLDGYLVTVGATTVALAAGASLDFLATFGIQPTEFTLSGIDPSLALDPGNSAAFPLGVSLVGVSGSVTITQTPITVDTSPVPIPAGFGLMLTAVGGLVVARRKKKKVDA